MQKYDQLQYVIEAHDPFLIPGFHEDEQLKWMCYKCPYMQKCQSMRSFRAASGGAA